MSDPGKPSQDWMVMMLLTLLVSNYARGADDELLVDPTMPLDVYMQEAGGGDETGGGFGFDLGAGEFFTGLLTSYELSSVLIRGDNRIAVINEERVREGDSIGNATVTAIEADRVTLNVNGETQVLELYANSIKTPVKGAD